MFPLIIYKQLQPVATGCYLNDLLVCCVRIHMVCVRYQHAHTLFRIVASQIRGEIKLEKMNDSPHTERVSLL